MKRSAVFKFAISREMILYWLFFGLCAGIAVWELADLGSTKKSPIFESFLNETITIEGVVADEQEKREFNTRIYVLVQKINGDEIPEGIRSEKILVTTTSPKDFRYGDLVTVKGKLSRPENFYTDTGREFDYVGYLESNDISYLIKNAGVTLLGHKPLSKIVAGLYTVKRAFVASLKRMLPEPESSLAAGILIDGKQSINGGLQEKFQKTGLVHIVVLSGYNVSIVAEAIGKAMMFLPRLLGLSSAIVGILAFSVVTGASATVVRASIMAVIVILSRMTLRNYDPARGLFIASFLMLIHNPTILFHSPSFQLSFLATFCVIKVVPWVENKGINLIRYIPDKLGLRELIVSNITVQVFLFPILSWMTGFVSAVSLPVNLLVLPLIPFTMLVCFIAALTGFIHKIIALPFAYISHVVLSYELTIVNFFSKFSLAEISFTMFSGFFVVSFYIVAILYFVVSHRSSLTREL